MDEQKIILVKSNDEELYFLDYTKGIAVDRRLAKDINMNEKEFQEYLIQNFNAQMHYIGEACFSNQEDGKRAIEWYDSVRLMSKLIST